MLNDDIPIHIMNIIENNKEIIKATTEAHDNYNYLFKEELKKIMIDENKRKNRNLLVKNIRMKYCCQQNDFLQKQQQQRKKIPDCEINLNSLAKQLDLKYLLLNNNYFINFLNITIHFKKLLSVENNPPINEIINSGAINHFIKFLDINNFLQFVNISPIPNTTINYYKLKPTVNLNQIYKLQYETIWVLTELAFRNCDVIVNVGIIPHLIELIKSDCNDLCHQSIWSLGNIIGYSTTIRDFALSQGVMKVLINDTWQLIKNRTTTMSNNFAWLLGNCLRGKPSPDWHLVKDCYPLLCEIIYNNNYNNNENVLTDCCYAFYFMSEIPDGMTEITQNGQLLKRLIELCLHCKSEIIIPALRTLSNIIATVENKEIQRRLLDGNILTALDYCLSQDKKSIKEEAAWTISNFLATIIIDNHSLVNQMLNTGIFTKVMEQLQNNDNLVLSGAYVKRLVFEYNVINGLSKFLNNDAQVIATALECLENIFKIYLSQLEKEEVSENEEFKVLLEKKEENNILGLLENFKNHRDEVVASYLDVSFLMGKLYVKYITKYIINWVC
ncbi:hypothetical protein ABK040_015096 [Willaertia magna]